MLRSIYCSKCKILMSFKFVGHDSHYKCYVCGREYVIPGSKAADSDNIVNAEQEAVPEAPAVVLVESNETETIAPVADDIHDNASPDAIAPPARKRGRPRKEKTEQISMPILSLPEETVSSVSPAESEETTEKRKRGRPRKLLNM